MSKHLHIAVATDANYVQYTCIMLTSLFANNTEFEYITVHVLATGLLEEHIDILHRHLPKDRSSLEIYDMSNIKSVLPIEIHSKISIASYSRLLLPQLLDKSIERVIYADVDSLLIGSLYELWNMDLQSYLVAGVLDDVSQKAKIAIGLNANSPYINAGFLLINLALWREENVITKILQVLERNNGVVFHHDQGLINAVCQNRIYILPPSYNLITNFYMKSCSEFRTTPFYTEQEIELAKSSPVFVHFTPGVANRPWSEHCLHPLKDTYIAYKNKTTYASTPLAKDMRPMRQKVLAWFFFYCKPIYRILLNFHDIKAKQ
jgi:lipopolysaccharide biosynthesis glycosyltransferase